MRKIYAFITALTISLAAFVNHANAEFGVYVSGNLGSVTADGTESNSESGSETDTSVVSATAGNEFIYGSIGAEYSWGMLTFGVDYVPGSADVNSSQLTRTDATSDSNESNQQDGTYKANAEIENHYTYYVELHSEMGLYGKLGMAKVDIKTNDEDAGTASTYPDIELDATTYGIGYKGSFGDNGYFKIEGSITDYDSFSVTSGSTNTVKGDLDTTQAKFAIGYNF